MYGYGTWLVENHYSVLIPDARGHGDSGGLATYGIREADDIHHWVDWIETNEPARCMYGLGESMGAAQLLQSLPREPRFCAVVVESPFASFREVAYARFGRPLHTGPWIGRSFFRPTVDTGFLCLPEIRLKHGKRVSGKGGRRSEDSSAPHSWARRQKYSALPFGLDQSQEPYLCRGVEGTRCRSDTGAHAVAPQEFERKVLEWFAGHTSASQPTALSRN